MNGVLEILLLPAFELHGVEAIKLACWQGEVYIGRYKVLDSYQDEDGRFKLVLRVSTSNHKPFIIREIRCTDNTIGHVHKIRDMRSLQDNAVSSKCVHSFVRLKSRAHPPRYYVRPLEHPPTQEETYALYHKTRAPSRKGGLIKDAYLLQNILRG